jgi:WD40 repeat protein
MSPDGSPIASCSSDGNLIIWNARQESLSRGTFLEHTSTGHDVVRAVAYCQRGERVATGGHDCTIKIWDNAGLLQATLCDHAERVLSVVWTKGGSRVISGSADCTARVWDPEGGKRDTSTYRCRGEKFGVYTYVLGRMRSVTSVMSGLKPSNNAQNQLNYL